MSEKKKPFWKEVLLCLFAAPPALALLAKADLDFMPLIKTVLYNFEIINEAIWNFIFEKVGLPSFPEPLFLAYLTLFGIPVGILLVQDMRRQWRLRQELPPPPDGMDETLARARAAWDVSDVLNSDLPLNDPEKASDTLNPEETGFWRIWDSSGRLDIQEFFWVAVSVTTVVYCTYTFNVIAGISIVSIWAPVAFICGLPLILFHFLFPSARERLNTVIPTIAAGGGFVLVVFIVQHEPSMQEFTLGEFGRAFVFSTTALIGIATSFVALMAADKRYAYLGLWATGIYVSDWIVAVGLPEAWAFVNQAIQAGGGTSVP